jgi:hypothetical protein
MRTGIPSALPLLCLLLSAACAIPVRDKSETLHYLVIGIGVVSIPAEQKTAAVQAARSHILGAGISNQPGVSLSLGYASSIVTRVPENTEDVRIEFSERPGGPVVVDVAASRIKSEVQLTDK